MFVAPVLMIAVAVSVSVRLGEDPKFDSGRMVFSVLELKVGVRIGLIDVNMNKKYNKITKMIL
jgi:hypothetical protein